MGNGQPWAHGVWRTLACRRWTVDGDEVVGGCDELHATPRPEQNRTGKWGEIRCSGTATTRRPRPDRGVTGWIVLSGAAGRHPCASLRPGSADGSRAWRRSRRHQRIDPVIHCRHFPVSPIKPVCPWSFLDSPDPMARWCEKGTRSINGAPARAYSVLCTLSCALLAFSMSSSAAVCLLACQLTLLESRRSLQTSFPAQTAEVRWQTIGRPGRLGHLAASTGRLGPNSLDVARWTAAVFRWRFPVLWSPLSCTRLQSVCIAALAGASRACQGPLGQAGTGDGSLNQQHLAGASHWFLPPDTLCMPPPNITIASLRRRTSPRQSAKQPSWASRPSELPILHSPWREQQHGIVAMGGYQPRQSAFLWRSNRASPSQSTRHMVIHALVAVGSNLPLHPSISP